MSPATTPSNEAKSGEQSGMPLFLAELLAAGKKVGPDPTLLLAQDHQEVEGYFLAYHLAQDEATKAVWTEKICLALTVHAQAEEELLYPAARKLTGEESLVDHAIEEHAEVKRLVAELQKAKSFDAEHDRKVRHLQDLVEEHVQEEEGRLFPELRQSALELYELGRAIAARRVVLLEQLTGKAPRLDS